MVDGRPDTGRRSRRAVLAGLGAAGGTLLAGCRSSPAAVTTTTAGDRLAGTIQIAGSSTVYPLTLQVGRQFAAAHEGVTVSVTSTGTGGGFTDFFCPGKTSLNDASRPITDAERRRCAENGVEFVRFRVATDALTVIANPAADWVDCVTTGELAAMWRRDGATTWADVRDGWPDSPIAHYGPTSDSGTFDYFAERVIGSVGAHRRDYEGTEQDSTIVGNVGADRDAVGYLGFAYYARNADRVKALEIEHESQCVGPSRSTAESGAYALLSRPLYVYAAKRELARPEVRAFLRYYLERVDTALVSDVGYVPLDTQTAARNLSKLARVSPAD
jgi:phosphate transport system substrate-binding protein